MEKLGRYEIRGTLGKGGMGVVFRVWDPELFREAAIKFILPEASANPEFRKRFKQEAGACGLLKHEGIVTVYDVGEFDERPYIVMEFLEGDSLEALFKNGQLARPRLLAILRRIAEALDFAHIAKIVHRDIKPANVMVTKAGSTKIMDFGLVKAGISGFTQTVPGTVMGSPFYMSPEQLHGEEITGAADQWALAVVAYEGLTGERPFQAETMPALAHRICNVPAPASDAMTAAELRAIQRALSKDPAKRYENCSGFVQALELAAAPAAGPSNGKYRWYAIAAGLMAVALAGWFFTPSAISKKSMEQRAANKEMAPKDGLYYVPIPPGKFRMGCSPGDTDCAPDETPREVEIYKGFRVGQTEVTVEAYKRFVSASGGTMPISPAFNPGWNLGQMPIVNVSWEDAKLYCEWAGGRLPKEAEWEYAARAGSGESRYGPLDSIAWYGANSLGGAHEAGERKPNAFGLHDMLGNVWEWVEEWEEQGKSKRLRGGAWSSAAERIRASQRYASRVEAGTDVSGFRCVLD